MNITYAFLYDPISLFYYISDIMHTLTPFTIFVRLLLAAIIGGIIGLERGLNSHPAGFRTHILICVAAALTTLTGDYIVTTMAPNADPARLGAQVITGMGFIGAGTIFVTGKHRIKGLTTAAGLWASAILGLAIGIGFYSGAIMAAIIIFSSLTLLQKFEDKVYKNSHLINIYLEISQLPLLKILCNQIESSGIEIIEKHISSSRALTQTGLAFHLILKLPKTISTKAFLESMEEQEGVLFIEEI